MRYAIISDHNPDEVADLVSDALNDGWTLQGGLVVTALPLFDDGTREVWYAQAIVHPTKD